MLNKNLILDVGMHNGQDTDFYLKKGFDVVAIEANKDLCTEVREKYPNELINGRLTVLNVAISDKSGMLSFFINKKNTKWSSIYSKLGKKGGQGANKVDVFGSSMLNVIKLFGVPYYMKIDIEGADKLAIRQVANLEIKPPFLSVEGGGPDMISMLEAQGYDRFAIVNQRKNPDLKCCNPPLEGDYVDYQFQMGASGMFGNEITQEWLDAETAKIERQKFADLIQEMRIEAKGDQTKLMKMRWQSGIGWYDTHACFSEYLKD